ncbi:hemerythrin domain-containing protein [Actinomadura sp. HBU206391]|uniref:hemerythrin domain-containing protein n=1 Tax=Actinomadura sp. HBU206391 TaxID=2731692 RepID=UPI0016503080|nr:hemerythrin domain-containing protein [Actinomadura sp. HBU206391]MBC6457262.1 hemerythrin domain-containing protein [Actinomadura sp. HBU206391]
MVEQRNDVIGVLTRDHRRFEELLSELRSTDEPQERRRLADELTIEVLRHSVVEERHLYPAVRRQVPGGDVIADKELTDHTEIDKLLHRLATADPSGVDFEPVVASLIDDINAHIRDEEHYLFPSLSDHFESDDLVRLGEQIESARREAPGAGLTDRVRDYLGRGRE